MSPINDNRFVIYEVCVEYDLPGYEDTDEDGEPTGIAASVHYYVRRRHKPDFSHPP
jgi:hypothetical protein